MNPLEVLADVYRLLSQYDDEAFGAAERLDMSAEVRTVVRTLRRAKRILERRADPHIKPPPERRGRQSRSSGERHGSPRATPSSKSENEAFQALWAIAGSSTASNSQLARTLVRCGVELVYRTKDTRTGLLRRAAKKLDSLSPNQRDRILDALRSLLAKGETEGWMDVIHSNKRQ